jgi:Tol biopolymer transport system component/DNA-binding winged helix-turn-helix (wHTH) protein
MNNNKIRFDGWALDPESGDLERAGVRTRLQEQPALVLKELIDHAGRVVTREQLIALLWPTGVVDFDTGLNTAIRKLRGALGDDADTPRYIETLPRRGYRFIGTLDAHPPAVGAAPADPARVAAADAPAPPLPPEAGVPHAPRGARTWATLGMAIIAVAGAMLWFAAQSRHGGRNLLVNAKITRLTDLSGREQAAEISRDGRFAVFLSDHDGPTDAWITEIGSGNYRNLTHGTLHEIINPLVRTLGFSADGSLVTFWQRRPDSSRAGDTNILAMPSKGGSLQTYLPDVAEVSWSRDGSRIAYHTSAPGDPMFVKDLQQPVARRIYAAPAGVHCHFPLWSPHDEFIYFVRGVPLDAWDVWRIRPSGADLERITFQDSRVSHPVLIDSRTVAYLATDSDGSGPWLYAIDLKERVARRLSFGLERYTSLAASADGRRLVATVANPKTSLWSLAIPPVGTVQTSALRLSSESVTQLAPRIGPDYVLYVSWRGGRQGIGQRVKGVNRELWSDAHGAIVGAPAIAPNGSRIAFTVSDGTRTLLYVMDSDGAHARVVADSLTLRGNPVWTPDGESVVSAVVHDGEPRLAIIYLNGSPPLELVSEYSIDPIWSPDGQFLLYSGADLGMTFPLRAVAGNGKSYGGLFTPVLTRGARRVVFWRDSQAIVVLRGEIGHKNFWLIELKTGAERQLTELPPEFDVREFDVSADGSQIIFDRVEENSEIALIERSL